MINFDEINSAVKARYPDILSYWLPGGTQSGYEYKCADLSGGAGGSMSVNTTSGKWADFATGESGGDPISLYAAINRISQGEAALKLAEEHGVRVPDNPRSGNGNRSGKKNKKQKWTALPQPPAGASDPDLNHWKHGRPSAHWKYRDASGRVTGIVCRFNLGDGGKEVIPIAWAVGDDGGQEWRWLSFPKPRPLYNLPALSMEGNVIIVEGEKCAEALQPLAEDISAPVISWPGGGKAVKHADWTPLAGRKCLIWPDHDEPGYATAAEITKILGQLGCEVRTLTPPQDKPKGWDCADWIDGYRRNGIPELDKKDLISFIREGLERDRRSQASDDQPPLPEEPGQAVDNDMMPEPPPVSDCPFQFLGYDRGVYYYLSRKTKQVVNLKPDGHSGKALMQLAPLSWWERKFPGKNSTNWDGAADFLINESNRVGVFDQTRIRGRGAWEDAGRSVLHTGGRLVVNGRDVSINDFETDYIYEIAKNLDQQVGGNPLSTRDANEFAKLCEKLNWTRSINAALLAGWCVVAPICGALQWRPHIWITGSKGTGKSWILENIIKPVVGGAALGVTSSTTEAGIRQTLGNDARPVVFDEAEGEDSQAQRRIQAVLELARQASSESAGAIHKGTTNGKSMSFHIRSCFLFASIGVNIHQDSDASRITILNLQPNYGEGATRQFESLQSSVFGLLTPEYCSSLRARSVSLVTAIRKNAVTFARAAAEHLGSQRTGDQIGALLAGYYSLFSAREIDLDAAREWITDQSRSWDEVTAIGESDETDEWRCLYSILGHTVRIQGRDFASDMSLGSLVLVALGGHSDFITRDRAEDVIKNYGIRPDTILPDQYFIVSNSDPRIKKILRDTPWTNGWGRLLLRIDGAEKKGSVTFSPGVRSRGTVLPVSLLKDEGEDVQSKMDI